MRARNVKPGFFKNEILGSADPLYSLVFEGLWCLADREGRLEDRPMRIHAEINPYRSSASTVQALDWLCASRFLIRYEHNGQKIIAIRSFREHQQPHVKEPPSKFPAPQNQDVVEAPDKHCTSTEVAALIPPSPFPLPDSKKVPSEPLSTSSTGSQSDPDPVPRETTDRTGESVARVFRHWREVHGHDRAQLDAKRRRLIRAALENYSEADLCLAISGYRNSPHHMGQNDRATVYDDIGLMLRDASHIDAGLRFNAEPPRTDLSAQTRRIIDQTEGWVPPEVRRAAN